MKIGNTNSAVNSEPFMEECPMKGRMCQCSSEDKCIHSTTSEELKKEWIDDYKKLIVSRGIEISAQGIFIIRDFINFLLAKQQEEFVKMIESKQEDDYKVLFQTPLIDKSCRCNFENGDIIEIDKEGRHKKCGKYLPSPVPIKTSFEQFKEDLLADIKSKLNK